MGLRRKEEDEEGTWAGEKNMFVILNVVMVYFFINQGVKNDISVRFFSSPPPLSALVVVTVT